MKIPSLILIILLPNLSSAQNKLIEFNRITTAQGLSSNVLYTSTQDKYGFIWFATADGLNRHDGNNFKIFRTDPSDSTSLSTNWIIIAKTDSENNLWLGTLGGGLCRFIPETEKFKTYYPFPKLKGDFRKNGIVCIEEDYQKRIWIATNTSGIFIFDKKSESFSQLNCPDSEINTFLTSQRVGGILEYPNGTFWFSTNGGLIKYIESENSFHVFPLRDRNLFPERVNYVKNDSKGRIWVSSSIGFHLLESVNDSTIELIQLAKYSSKIKENEIFDFLEDDKGNFWITGQNMGLLYFDPSTKKLNQYLNDSENSHTVSSNSAYTLMKDREGNIWMNTVDNGSTFFKPENKTPFISFRYNAKDDQLKLIKNITSIHSRNDSLIWMGTDHGIVSFNRINSSFKNYDTHNGLSNNSVWSIHQTSDQSVWAGTSSGLNQLNPSNGKIISYFQNRNDSTKLQSQVILSLLESDNKKLWIGTQRGLHVFDRNKNVFKFFQPSNDNHEKLIYGINISLYEDSGNHIWIGTNGGGMSRYNQETEIFTSWKQEHNSESGLSNNSVISFYEDGTKNIFIGTSSGGLNIYNPQTNSFKFVRKSDGLISDGVFGIFKDAKDNVWISSALGLSRLSFKNNKLTSVRNFDLTDGLPTIEFGYQAFFKDSKGRLYFGGTEGFTFFHPDRVTDSNSFPELVFTGLKKCNREFETDSSMTVKQNLNLDYTDTFFSLGFTSVCFDKREKIRYAYKLENFDGDWIYIGSKNEISYTNLDPGHYKLFLKSTNSEGMWNPNPKILTINIKPPFWKTFWFSGFSVIVFSLVLILIIRAVISKKYKKIILELERQKELQLVKENTREQISRDLHDDVATTLNSISLYLKTIKFRAGKNPEMVNESIEKLDRLSEQAKE